MTTRPSAWDASLTPSTWEGFWWRECKGGRGKGWSRSHGNDSQAPDSVPQPVEVILLVTVVGFYSFQSRMLTF